MEVEKGRRRGWDSEHVDDGVSTESPDERAAVRRKEEGVRLVATMNIKKSVKSKCKI